MFNKNKDGRPMERRFFSSLFKTTVGQKYIMAVAGLSFYLFLIVHLLGNSTLFFPPEAMNKYAHTLEKVEPIIVVVEIFLLAVFLLHVILGIIVTLKNWSSRPVGYKMVTDAGAPSKKTISSKTMIWTGLIILVFVILHLLHFKFGPKTDAYMVTMGGEKVWNLHKLVVEKFQNTTFLVWYLIALAVMGFHLRHAFWSSFQSLGLGNEKYTPILINLSTIFAIVIAGGFILMALFVHFKY